MSAVLHNLVNQTNKHETEWLLEFRLKSHQALRAEFFALAHEA